MSRNQPERSDIEWSALCGLFSDLRQTPKLANMSKPSNKKAPDNQLPLPGQVSEPNSGIVSMKTSKQLEHITVANSKSPLLRLPAEIRNQIFELAFTSPSPSSTIHILYQTCTGTARDDLAIQLPFTCRQLYAETANMVYSLNTFLFVRQYHMEEWLAKRLPVQRELIEQITVCTDYMSATCGGYPTRMSVLRSAFLAAKPMCPNLKRVTDPAYLPLAGGI